MIKLFITDIDGCLTIPFETPDWEKLSQIRRLNEQSNQDLAVPPLSICSGRPMSYVEAVAQWMGVEKPVVFESAGMYKLSTNTVTFSSVFDEEAAEQVTELKEWMNQKLVPNYPGMIPEFTKRMDAGIIHLKKEIIDEIYPRVVEHVNGNYPRFEVHNTDVSVNVILSNNNKRNGILQLCEELELETDEIAYIGDSSGDISGLKIVGQPFAPANATEAVKEHAKVLDVKATDAVLMAYERIIEINRKILADVG
ncbi:MAG TPA: HAD-IIB family hydrolase [Balneolaceae bacterium]|nr:HAD-IIB family hydrolase [Balneolaceae bacterium]